jgi:arsenate reductase
MSMKVYQYPRCSTCRKALKWLDAHGVDYRAVDITESPPSKAELQQMLGHYDGDRKRLFNTSGQSYRQGGIKDRLPTLSDAEAIELLHEDGKLIKRPFVLAAGTGLVGFKEEEWTEVFG